MDDIAGEYDNRLPTPQRTLRDSSIAGSGSEAPPAVARRARVRRLVTRGPLCVFLIFACADGWPSRVPSRLGGGPPTAAANVFKAKTLVGAVLGAWELYTTAGAAATQSRQWITTVVSSAFRVHVDVHSFVTYEASAAVSLLECVSVGKQSPRQILDLAGGVFTNAGCTLRQWVDRQNVRRLFDVALQHDLAFAVASLAWSCFFAVAVVGKTARRRFIGSGPSRRVLKQWVLAVSGSGDAGPRRDRMDRPYRGMLSAFSAQNVVDWVGATRYMLDLKKSKLAMSAWSVVLCNHDLRHASELVSNCEKVGREAIRRARIRIDCCAMLLFRKFWALLDLNVTHIHIFADGAPQWRGTGMFAASFDLFSEGLMHRRLFPCISLPRNFLSARCKAYAILWQIYLIVGPSFQAVRNFCGCIRSFTTDNGAERLLADSPDLLVSFFRGIGAPTRGLTLGSRLFPLTVLATGWRHLWDTVLRRALFSLPYFPTWIKHFKALVYFIRDRNNLATISASLRSRGLNGLADVVVSAKLEHFAKWRWCTLDNLCRDADGFLRSFAANFDPRPFANVAESENKARLTLVLEACTSKVFFSQFDVVRWVCSWVCDILRYAGACECHMAEFLRREPVDCMLKGRVLKSAFKFATERLTSGLAEANSWAPTHFDGNVQVWQSAQGCARSTFALGSLKVRPFGSVPYLLARLGEPGVRDAVVTQFNAAPAEAHHPVTLKVLSPSSRLRVDIDRMHADGGGMSEALKAEVI